MLTIPQLYSACWSYSVVSCVEGWWISRRTAVLQRRSDKLWAQRWGSVVTISSGGELSSWIVVTQRTFPSEETPSYTEKPPLYRDVSKTPSRTTSTQEVRASTHQRCSCCWSSGLCCVLWHLCNILRLRVSWGKRNLELMVVTWDEALNVAKDRSERRNCDDKHTASL